MNDWVSQGLFIQFFLLNQELFFFVVYYYVGVSINKYNSIDTWVRWGVLKNKIKENKFSSL